MMRFGVVGAGWRSEFYIRIANALPDMFDFAGIYIRNPETAQKFSKKYDVNICPSLDELLDSNPDFVVSCVNKASMCDEVKQVEFGQNLCVYNSRSGYISPAEKNATHTLAFLDYGNKTALYD